MMPTPRSRAPLPRLRLDLAYLLHALPEEHDVVLHQPAPRLEHPRRDEREQRQLGRD